MPDVEYLLCMRGNPFAKRNKSGMISQIFNHTTRRWMTYNPTTTYEYHTPSVDMSFRDGKFRGLVRSGECFANYDEDGLLHGAAHLDHYFDDGCYDANFKHGMLHGECIEHTIERLDHFNTYNFVDGMLHGMRKTFDPKKNILVTSHYENGVLHGKIEADEAGWKIEGEVVDAMPISLKIWYNNILVRDGYDKWYDDGKIRAKAEDGIVTTYTNTGIITKTSSVPEFILLEDSDQVVHINIPGYIDVRQIKRHAVIAIKTTTTWHKNGKPRTVYVDQNKASNYDKNGDLMYAMVGRDVWSWYPGGRLHSYIDANGRGIKLYEDGGIATIYKSDGRQSWYRSRKMKNIEEWTDDSHTRTEWYENGELNLKYIKQNGVVICHQSYGKNGKPRYIESQERLEKYFRSGRIMYERYDDVVKKYYDKDDGLKYHKEGGVIRKWTRNGIELVD